MPELGAAAAARWAPRVVEAGLLVHLVALFVPIGTGFQNTGLLLAALATLIFAGAAYWRRLAGEPILLALLALFGWLLAVSPQAPDPLGSADEVRKILLGPLLVAACAPFGLADAASRQRLLLVLGASAVAVAMLDVLQYAREIAELGGFAEDVHLHRHYADPFVMYLPFCLALAAAPAPMPHLWQGMVVLLAVLLAGTGARGAWLAALAGALAWIAFRRERKALAGLGATLLLVAGLGWTLLPSSLFESRIRAGFDTSLRTTGTWLPAIEMIAERPLTGFGYGKKIFHAEFDRRAPQREHWTLKKSMGPHSIFFEAGFAGGVPAMALLGGLLGVILHRGTQRLPSLADARDQRLLVAALCALVAFYLVRGMVESVRWGPLGIVLAVVLPLTCCVDTKRQPDRPPPGTADAP